MGLAKQAQIEADDRGWWSIDGYVCAECVGEEFLSNFVKDNASQQRCEYRRRRHFGALFGHHRRGHASFLPVSDTNSVSRLGCNRWISVTARPEVSAASIRAGKDCPPRLVCTRSNPSLASTWLTP